MKTTAFGNLFNVASKELFIITAIYDRFWLTPRYYRQYKHTATGFNDHAMRHISRFLLILIPLFKRTLFCCKETHIPRTVCRVVCVLVEGKWRHKPFNVRMFAVAVSLQVEYTTENRVQTNGPCNYTLQWERQLQDSSWGATGSPFFFFFLVRLSSGSSCHWVSCNVQGVTWSWNEGLKFWPILDHYSTVISTLCAPPHKALRPLKRLRGDTVDRF